jgi:hypothetical protein
VAPVAALPPPDLGPAVVPARSGMCCVGATPWVVNFNVLLESEDLDLGRELAAAVSERRGGLPGVQAMALRHEDGEGGCRACRPWPCATRTVRGAAGRAGHGPAPRGR